MRSRSVLLRHRGVRLLWFGETTSTFGTRINNVVLPLVAVEVLHASDFVVSAITAAAWLPWLLFGLVVGPFVDRSAKRPLMIVCDLVSAVLFASIPVAGALGVLTAGQLVAVAFAAGTVSVVFVTAYSVFLIDLVDDHEVRAQANGVLQGSSSAANVAGPGAAGLIAATVGSVAAILANSASFLVSAACLGRVRVTERPVAVRGERGALRRQVADGLAFLRRDPLLRPIVLFGGTANLALIGYQALIVVFLVRTVGLTASTVGLLLTCGSVGGVIGAAVGNPLARWIGSGRALLATKVGATPFALLIPLTSPGPRIALVVIGSMGVGLGIVAGNVISSSFVQGYTPPELYARTTATTNLFNYGTMPLGALLGGTLASAFGLRDALWMMTALLPATALFLVASPLRSIRTLPSQPPGDQGADALPPAGHLDGRAVRTDLGPVVAHVRRVEAEGDDGIGSLRLGFVNHSLDDLFPAGDEVLGHPLELAADEGLEAGA